MSKNSSAASSWTVSLAKAASSSAATAAAGSTLCSRLETSRSLRRTVMRLEMYTPNTMMSTTATKMPNTAAPPDPVPPP